MLPPAHVRVDGSRVMCCYFLSKSVDVLRSLSRLAHLGTPTTKDPQRLRKGNVLGDRTCSPSAVELLALKATGDPGPGQKQSNIQKKKH